MVAWTARDHTPSRGSPRSTPARRIRKRSARAALTPTPDAIIAAYDADAATLVEAYDALDPAALYAPVRDLFPQSPARIADVGAGTGRDASWLARLGHRVAAVEPAHGLREWGRGRPGRAEIEWLDDRLPDLRLLSGRAVRFDLILASGIWHHLGEADSARAMMVLARLLAPGGTLILSLRHGPAPAARPGFDLPVADTISLARSAGLDLLADRSSASLLPGNRAAGVHWTWVAVRKRFPCRRTPPKRRTL